MQADGIIDRPDFKEIPPKVEYALTPFGKTLAKALAPLCGWGTEHMIEVEALMSTQTLSMPPDPSWLRRILHRRLSPSVAVGPTMRLQPATA